MCPTVRRTSILIALLILSHIAFAQRRPPGPSAAPVSPASHPPATERQNPYYGPLTDSSGTLSARSEGKVEFSSESDLVEVPVVVTNKAGEHVTGLHEEDFILFEDGEKQKIESFDEIRAANSSIAQRVVPKGEHSEYSNVTPATREAHQIVVILLDTVNTPFLDQSYARKQLIKFLSDAYPGGAPTTLVSLDYKGMHVLHDFTSDPKELVESLHKLSGMIPAMTEEEQDNLALSTYPQTFQSLFSFMTPDTVIAASRSSDAIESTLECFMHLAQSFAGVPGRKSLIWVTGGFPFLMTDPSSVPGYGMASMYERTLQTMSAANISIYPVDARGLVSYGYAGAVPSGARTAPVNRAQTNAARSALEADIRTNLEDFAKMTGGRAFYNNNDLTRGFKQAEDDGESYYVLHYYLQHKNRSSGWRKLKVEVRGNDLHVLARSGFLVTPTTANTIASRPLDMLAALHSPLDATGLPLAMRWTGAGNEEGKRKVSFLLGSAPNQVRVNTEKGNHLSVDIAVLVKKKSGEDALQFARSLNTDLKAENVEQLQKQGFGYPGQIEVAPGDYIVRFVMRDNTTGRVGSLSAPLEVK